MCMIVAITQRRILKVKWKSLLNLGRHPLQTKRGKIFQVSFQVRRILVDYEH